MVEGNGGGGGKLRILEVGRCSCGGGYSKGYCEGKNGGCDGNCSGAGGWRNEGGGDGGVHKSLLLLLLHYC